MSELPVFSQAYEINGIHTEFVLQPFDGKFLLIITQYEKITNFFVASKDVEIAYAGADKNYFIDIKHLFGTTSDEIEFGIRNFMKKINKPVEIYFCLGLKHTTPDLIKQIQLVLDKCFPILLEC